MLELAIVVNLCDYNSIQINYTSNKSGRPDVRMFLLYKNFILRHRDGRLGPPYVLAARILCLTTPLHSSLFMAVW